MTSGTDLRNLMNQSEAVSPRMLLLIRPRGLSMKVRPLTEASLVYGS